MPIGSQGTDGLISKYSQTFRARSCPQSQWSFLEVMCPPFTPDPSLRVFHQCLSPDFDFHKTDDQTVPRTKLVFLLLCVLRFMPLRFHWNARTSRSSQTCASEADELSPKLNECLFSLLVLDKLWKWRILITALKQAPYFGYEVLGEYALCVWDPCRVCILPT